MLVSTAVVFSATDDTDALPAVSSSQHRRVATPHDLPDSMLVHAIATASPQVQAAITALTTLVDSLTDDIAQAGLRSIIQSLDTGDAATVHTRLSELLSSTTNDGDRSTLSAATFILESLRTATTTTTISGTDSDDDEEESKGDDREAAATAAGVASIVLNDAPPAVISTSTLHAAVADDDNGGEAVAGVVGSTVASTFDAVNEEDDEEDDGESENGDDAERAAALTSPPLTSTETE